MSLDSDLTAAIEANVAAALAEDIGSGDITAELIDSDRTARACVITRESGVFCGQHWAEETCRRVDPRIRCNWKVEDGERISVGQLLVELEGPARGLLTAERTLLNFLQLLSGTATLARRYADAAAGASVRVLDTRKTLPGLRIAQKYAVRCGGCHNHRIGLYDAFLIKENHIAASGSIAAAIARARQIAPTRLVEVEVEDLAGLREALVASADVVMLDNFDAAAMREAVAINQNQVKLEASGGVNFETFATIAATGVDYISVGELTKRVQPIDLSMRFHD